MTKTLKKPGDSLSPSRLSKGLKDPLRRTRSNKTKSSSVVEGLTPSQQTGVIDTDTENFHGAQLTPRTLTSWDKTLINTVKEKPNVLSLGNSRACSSKIADADLVLLPSSNTDANPGNAVHGADSEMELLENELQAQLKYLRDITLK